MPKREKRLTKRERRIPDGKHRARCPYWGLALYVEFRGTETTAHHEAPICAQFLARAQSFDNEVSVTPGDIVRGRFEN